MSATTTRWVLWMLAATAATAGAGCEVDSFCLNCADGAVAMDAGDARRDAGPRRRDAGPRDGGVDSGETDACVPEECNGHDDDCDGETDEDFDLSTDLEHCGACGDACQPAGAFGECVEGACVISACDVGRHDLDEDPSNGCEYACLATAEDDARCDFEDEDCDEAVDEDVDLESDLDNCGMCGRACRFTHAAASCTTGECVMGECEAGFVDADGRFDNGCELSCTPAEPAVESCNGTDDDCDGAIDEGDPGGGAACGSAEGACTEGTEMCRGGRIECVGGVQPAPELCNRADDDCDGSVDEGDPEGGRLCGAADGVCEQGIETCVDGSVECVGGVGPGTEECNGRDDDCDGSIDENNPGGGTACGGGRGECEPGVMQCRGGVLVCEGEVGPVDETCNLRDDDCDGSIDENDPGGGRTCGTDVGVCSPGTTSCVSGVLRCEGDTPPRAGGELCNALDDDCDGEIDEGNPEGGASCGESRGTCESGMVACVGGRLSCEGDVGPSAEVCDGLDNDCDEAVDETIRFSTDPLNCGSCGRVCSFENASASCSDGACVQGPCDAGFHDVDELPGCEYECTERGEEACNVIDDDCDGSVDEGITAPMTFCNPNGVCAGTTATCSPSGFTCEYPSTYEDPETTCDGLDNDCDGRVDEAYAGIGQPCSQGVGVCQRTGTVVCTSPNSAGCDAEEPGTPAGDVLCHGRDDDGDGTVDEGHQGGTQGFPPGPGGIPTVQMVVGGQLVDVMRYEASRTDASESDSGSRLTLACSNSGVLPWTDVSWDEARMACCALNPDGTCAADGSGWRLCDATHWERACRGPSAACEWSYGSSCTVSAPLTCNGAEHDCADGGDCPFPTGSSDFAMCYTAWSGGNIYDLSGNVKEWTSTPAGTDVYEVRGGSYNNLEDGRTCGFDFTVGHRNFAAPNVGFRCCHYQ